MKTILMHIITTNVLNKIYEDWTIHQTSRVLTRETYPPPDLNVTSTVTTAQPTLSHNFNFLILPSHIRKAAPYPGGLPRCFMDTCSLPVDRTKHVTSTELTRKLSRPLTIFKLSRDNTRTNVLTTYHEDWTKKLVLDETAPPPCGNEEFPAPLRPNCSIDRNTFSYQIHDDWTINVTFRVKNAPSPNGHVLRPTGTIFDLVQDIIGINLLTKFH
ncbi:hypothetical protein DPMN_175248 [Dreissena polymorpha]|uniref:Uncharacterized protein n=1 Tax=Dreissena polymorpha TaxID=45954 RepID=A0A9D4E4V2_DREPO|nr:hypothetical protein DPMN_175248 [Dreissena polymorpha]